MLEINKIHLGDCLELMKNIEDKSVDCIICDLPYNTTECKWDSIIPFDKLWEQYKRIRKDNTPIVLFGSEPFSTYLRMSNIKEYRYDLIWHKNSSGSFALANKMPMKYHENISIFYKLLPIYNPQYQEYSESTQFRFKNGERVNRNKQLINSTNQIQGGISFEGKSAINYDRGKYPESVLIFNNVANNQRVHPTEKPISLIQYLIKTYSNENDLILDNCSGSGSLAVAAYNTHRNFICIEKNEEYYKKSVERLERVRSQEEKRRMREENKEFLKANGIKLEKETNYIK